jgi:hypothetical protein
MDETKFKETEGLHSGRRSRAPTNHCKCLPILWTTFNVFIEIKTNTHQTSMKTWPYYLFLHTNFGFWFYLLYSLRFQKTNKRKIVTNIWKENSKCRILVLQPYLSPSIGFQERVKKYKLFVRKFSIYLVLAEWVRHFASPCNVIRWMI